MQTLEKASLEYANKYVSGCRDIYPANQGEFIDAFEAGVEFAQRFYPIERDQYAKIDLNQKDELIKNMPIIVMYLNEYGEESYDIFSEYTSMLEIPDHTHWRPINIK